MRSNAPPEADAIDGAELPPVVEQQPTQTDRIRAIMSEHAGQLKFCYEDQLRHDPDVAGRLTLEIELAGGELQRVEIVDDAGGDEAFAECIMDRVETWDWSGLDDAVVRWPIVLAPAAR